jgi:phosphatidylserine synthase
MFKGTMAYKKNYFIGKYIVAYGLLIYLLSLVLPMSKGFSLITVIFDFLIIRFSIIKHIEIKDELKIEREQLRYSFNVFTSIFLVAFYYFLLNTAWYYIVVIVVLHLCVYELAKITENIKIKSVTMAKEELKTMKKVDPKKIKEAKKLYKKSKELKTKKGKNVRNKKYNKKI